MTEEHGHKISSADDPGKDPAAASRPYLLAANMLKDLGRDESALVLAKKSLAVHETVDALKTGFWVALRLRVHADAESCLVRLRERLDHADARNQAWLENAEQKFRNLPINAEALMPLLRHRVPCQFVPVTKRICYVLHNSLPFSSGGYATRGHGMARGLQDSGYEIIVVNRPGFPLDVTDLQAGEVTPGDLIDGIPYRRILAPTRRSHKGQDYVLSAAEALKSALRELRPELVMAASNHPNALLAQIAARALGIPFIYEIRGLWEITRWSREPGFRETREFADQARLETISAQNADHVFTLTAQLRDELVIRGVPGERISLLPNSSDPARFTPRPRDAALASRLGISENVPVIGYIGSFVQYEGLEDLTRACAILAGRGVDFRLLLVGNENASGNDRGPITAEIERIAAEGGLTDRLIMPGRVPHHEVESWYSLIDIAPFPRKPQPVTEMVSPMKPLEAMAMAKAVLVSSVGALRDMVIPEETGLVFDKGNIDSMAAGLERLIRDPALRQRLGARAREWVQQERTWKITARKAKAVIDRIVASA